MAARGSAIRAEGNATLRALCTSCGKSISTEAGHAHPLDERVRSETHGLLVRHEGRARIFAVCTACYDSGWRPPHFAAIA